MATSKRSFGASTVAKVVVLVMMAAALLAPYQSTAFQMEGELHEVRIYRGVDGFGGLVHGLVVASCALLVVLQLAGRGPARGHLRALLVALWIVFVAGEVLASIEISIMRQHSFQGGAALLWIGTVVLTALLVSDASPDA